MIDLQAKLAELTADAWAMEPSRLNMMFHQLADVTTRPLTALPGVTVTAAEPVLQIRTDGTAVIPIVGVLTKQPLPSWMAFFGIVGTTYGQIRSQVGQAVADPVVKRIELRIESPGGQVAGVQETAEAIAAAAKEKTVVAVTEDLVASAAYWLASQADTITANPNAFVGSIGVYSVYADYSAMAEKLGVTVHVIRSGEHKGMGVMGAKITDVQIAAMQENIDRIAGHFVDAVAAGRNLTRDEAQALATGRLWEASAAVQMKLIDAVSGANAGMPAATITKPSPKGDAPMGQTNDQQAPAVDADAVRAETEKAERQRLAALQGAFPKDPEFAMQQFAAGASLTEAKAAYSDVLAERLAEQEKKAATAAPQPQVAGADARIGATAGEGNEQADADDGPDFLTVSREYAAKHRCSIATAMMAVRLTNRPLHERYLEQCMAQARAKDSTCERVAN